MPNVTVTYHPGDERTYDLETALEPSTHTTWGEPVDERQLDFLLGRLLAKLVEKNLFTLEDAREVLNGFPMQYVQEGQA